MKITTTAIITLVLAAINLTSFAGDWPQWRGPNRDGVSTEKGLLDKWPEGGPKLVWKAEGVGEGFASVSVKDGMIYTMGDGKETSHVFCLDAKSGKILWTSKAVGKTGGNYKGTPVSYTHLTLPTNREV